MSVDVEAAKKAGNRQRFDKPPPDSPAHEPTHEPIRSAPKKAAAKRRKRRETKGEPDTINDAEVERMAAEARSAAEEEAAAVAPPKPAGPKMSKAQRERVRRAGRRVVTAELDPADGARLDALAEIYGSQRAALTEAVRQLYAGATDQ